MSAICGAVGLDGRPYEGRDLAGMLTALAELAPDGAGQWAGQVGTMPVAVGAALRHRVRQDATERQPAVSWDGRIVVVADAVLDNRAELAGLVGVPDSDHVPDSRFLLAAYQRWGPDCPSRLTGEFAFAAVDTGRGGVLLARDQVGHRPLHLHQRDGVLAFASTALALTGFDGVGHELDPSRVAEYLSLLMASDRSWIAGVRPVPPATAMWVDGRGVRSWQYWQLDPAAIDTGRQPAEHATALRAALDAAVAGRLARGGSAGVSLSGGLDSTSVAATAATLLGGDPLHTYTSVPAPDWRGEPDGRRDPDESHLVRELAGWYPNLRPSFVDARGLSFLAGYENVFAAGGTPPRNVCNVMWARAIHRAATADGVRVLLSGAAGNLFYSADDPTWLAALLRCGQWSAAGRELVRWRKATGLPLRKIVRSSVLAELAPPALHRLRGRRAASGRAASALLSQACGLHPDRTELLDPQRVATLHGSANLLRTDPFQLLAGAAGQAEFLAAEQACSGLYLADPTADLRVVMAGVVQPPWVRRRDGVDRAVCREAMTGRLPDSIRLRTVHGLQLPDWLDRLTDARAELSAELAAAREYPAVRDLIDVERLDEALREWPAPTTAPSRQLVARYRFGLLRPLLAARYIRWFTERGTTGPGGRHASVVGRHCRFDN